MTRHAADATPFQSWLSLLRTSPNGDYHLKWTPKTGAPIDPQVLRAMRTYFESAHRDAQKHLREVCRIDLHPVASTSRTIEYPRCLPDNARKANFGEVLCGAVAEAYLMFGDKEVTVPVFLLRADDNVRNYLMRLRAGGTVGLIPGRVGDDFIGFECGDDGRLTAVVVGEAKFRGNLPQSVYNDLMFGTSKLVPSKAGKSKTVKTQGVLEKLSGEPDLPVSLFQIADILAEISRVDFEDIIVSIDEIAAGRLVVPRRDFVLLVMGDRAVGTPPPYSSQTTRASQYTANRQLEIVELHIPDAQTWIDALYDSLYSVP
jgi:hypothetical protein